MKPWLLIWLAVASVLSGAFGMMPELSPSPKRTIEGERFPLPVAWRVVASSALPRDDPGLQRLMRSFAAHTEENAGVASYVVQVGFIPQTPVLEEHLATIRQTERLPDDLEAFFIHVTPDGAFAGGRSGAGLYYGMLALAQWIEASTEEITGGWVLDWPSLAHRSYMIDSSRLMEKKDYYRKMLRYLSEARYNVMLLHMIDYPGITLKYKSHPEPADPNAWTPEEIGELQKLAAQYHIDLMPEVELFGHAGGWTRHEVYKELGEGRGGGSFKPQNPKTYELTGDLVKETTDLFPFPLFHAGLDEVNYPTSLEGRAYAREHGMNRWLTDHIQKVYAQIKSENRRMVMWGDMLYKRMGTAYAIPRDVVIYDWHYSTLMDGQWNFQGENLEPPASWSYFRQLGFDVVAAPSLVCGGYRLWPDVRRINNCVGSATEAAQYGLMGVGVTVWAPARYIPDALWYATAVSGDAAWAGYRYDRDASDKGFFRSFYGTDFTDADRDALYFMLDHTPDQTDLWTLLMVDNRYRERFQKISEGRMWGILAEAEAARKHWESRLSSVTRHRDEYMDFLLVSHVIEHLAWRAEHGKAILAGDTALRAECLRQTEALHKQLVESWKRNRYEDPSTGKIHDPMPNGFLIADFYRGMQALEE